MKPIDNHIGSFRLALDRLVLPQFAARSPARPYIAALEGANGAGKTTVCRLLSAGLGVATCLGTDRAWFSDEFKVRMIRDADWHASAMFFLSGCFEQMRVLAGRRDWLVVMDRSLWSTLAVQAAADAERLEILLKMLVPVAHLIQTPDLTVVLEASFETCQQRIAQKAGAARALDELTANAAFHEREREFYLWLGRQLPSLEYLDANERGAEQIALAIVALMSQRGLC